VVEATDLDDQTRHMDMDYAVIRWSDKPYVCYGTSGPKARDARKQKRVARVGAGPVGLSGSSGVGNTVSRSISRADAGYNDRCGPCITHIDSDYRT
jgi:hypothetical protein